MAENKTKPTGVSVASYLSAIKDEARRKDCKALAQLMSKATKAKPTMWGPGIVGFGSYHYKYATGREGDSCLTGFASRKADVTVYLTARFPGEEALLAQLGRHKMSGSCLHIRALSDVDTTVLSRLITGCVKEMKRRHGPAPA